MEASRCYKKPCCIAFFSSGCSGQIVVVATATAIALQLIAVPMFLDFLVVSP